MHPIRPLTTSLASFYVVVATYRREDDSLDWSFAGYSARQNSARRFCLYYLSTFFQVHQGSADSSFQTMFMLLLCSVSHFIRLSGSLPAVLCCKMAPTSLFMIFCKKLTSYYRRQWCMNSIHHSLLVGLRVQQVITK